jgi:transcriptional regulator with XRE-family HTH domain
MPDTLKHSWLKDALQKRGYRQRDLARAWAVAEASVSRFISGEENQNLTLSKAVALSRMLGIALDDLAKALGFEGPVVEPSIPQAANSIPVGTLSMDIVEQGKLRLTLCQDLPASAAAEIIQLLSKSAAPMPSGGPLPN